MVLVDPFRKDIDEAVSKRIFLAYRDKVPLGQEEIDRGTVACPQAERANVHGQVADEHPDGYAITAHIIFQNRV